MQGNLPQDFTVSAATLRAIEIDPQTDPRWEALMDALPHSLIYHHPAWLRVLEEAYGCTPIYLACEDDTGRLWGVLPLSYKRGLLTGRNFSSLLGTPVAGPLAYNEPAVATLMHAAIERTRSEPGIPLEMHVFSNAVLEQVVDGVIGVPASTTYLLEVPGQQEPTRLGNSRSHAAIKRAVNKATRLGVQVRPAETARELWAWYGLYVDTMHRLAVLPRSYQFFKSAWEQLRPRRLMQLLLAEHHEAGQIKLLGGLFLLMFGQTVHYAYGGWCREDQSLRPNDALHWQAIQDARAHGFRYYDWGVVLKDNQGLAKYKSKWGAQPKWIYHYRYLASQAVESGRSASSNHPRKLGINIHASSSRTRRFALAILRRLPIKAVALLSNWAHHL
jgi:hypothetical protein